jgi:hypothetical protein
VTNDEDLRRLMGIADADQRASAVDSFSAILVRFYGQAKSGGLPDDLIHALTMELADAVLANVRAKAGE